MSRIVGLIGDPVAHSVSPAFQQAAFDALGIDARYEAWRTPAADLAQQVATLRSEAALGANVTVPHKQAVMDLLDEVDDAARRTGAVNTIVNRDGRLYGYNTDIGGFLAALCEDGGFEPAGCRAVVLGAGGAARAVVFGLLAANARQVVIVNRTAGKARELAAQLNDARCVAADHASSGPSFATVLGGCDLLVNCTTIGMRHSAAEASLPAPAEAIPPNTFVADIVANPLVTPLLAAAARRGNRTLGGLPMLVRQGAASFEFWTHRPAPLDVMFAAARRAMGVGGPASRAPVS